MTHPDLPPCVICTKRPAAQDSQACWTCGASLDTDLAAIPDLTRLLPAAVAPSLRQVLDRGARSAEVAMPGGEALNLIARSNPEVRLRYVPLMGTEIVPVVRLVEPPGCDEPIADVRWRREPVLDPLTGRPVLVPDGDQHGDLDPWLVVARWAAEWAELRGVGEVGAGGVRWLRERLDWACREHPDLAGWADEVRHVVGGMRAILAVKIRVERYKNRCPACNNAQTLFRVIDPMMDPDDRRTKYVNCAACPALFEVDDERVTERQAA